MVTRKPGMARRGKSVGARNPSGGILVEEEQRKHLIEDCAYFRAARFRPAGPGGYRRQDLQAAASAIDAVIKPRRGRGKGK